MKAQKRNELRKVYISIFGGTLVPHTLKFTRANLDMLDACRIYTEETGYGVLEMTPHGFIFKPFKQGKIIEHVKELKNDNREFFTSC